MSETVAISTAEAIADFLAIPENESLSNTRVAKALGINERAIRRYKLARGINVSSAARAASPTTREPKYTTLRLDQITIDNRLQTRAGADERGVTNPEAVDDYADAVRDGIILPAVDVFRDGDVLRLAEGFHRFAAYAAAGKTSLPVAIHEGDWQAAFRFALVSNRDHGIRLTNEDKRNKVRMCLANAPTANFSGREGARACGVSFSLFESVAGEMAEVKAARESGQREYTDKHGTRRVMDTSGIKEAAAEKKARREAEKAEAEADTARTRGQSRVNGQLVEDPPEIAEKRAAGKIAPGVVPIITTSDSHLEPSANGKPDREPGDHEPETDEEWLQTLPLYHALQDAPRRWFGVDALLYRAMTDALSTFKHHASRALAVAGRSSSKGAYAYRLNQFLKVDGPAHWRACPPVENGGCGGTGQVDQIGECQTCFGRGYLLH